MNFDEFFRQAEEQASDGPDCGHDDCNDESFLETTRAILRHLRQNFTDEAHKSMSPPCFTCVTFFMGLSMGQLASSLMGDDDDAA